MTGAILLALEWIAAAATALAIYAGLAVDPTYFLAALVTIVGGVMARRVAAMRQRTAVLGLVRLFAGGRHG